MQETSSSKPHSGGSIILTASVAGLRSGAGSMDYSASKAAVVSLAQTAAWQLARTNVRVNAVCPGLIETGMTYQLLIWLEKEVRLISNGVLFLASDDASYVNGIALPICGDDDEEISSKENVESLGLRGKKRKGRITEEGNGSERTGLLDANGDAEDDNDNEKIAMIGSNDDGNVNSDPANESFNSRSFGGDSPWRAINLSSTKRGAIHSSHLNPSGSRDSVSSLNGFNPNGNGTGNGGGQTNSERKLAGTKAKTAAVAPPLEIIAGVERVKVVKMNRKR
ncbi:hypothetical protein L7F22_048521 [Adiantum nelumboides]|nr:hypothetical protein [Adiantum nelumboides]